MKKFLALLLVAGLFTFTGCKKKEATKTQPKSPPSETKPTDDKPTGDKPTGTKPSPTK